MGRTLIALGLVWLAVASARAEPVYYLERGSWWVGNVAGGCVAGSRPAIETNVSPFMNLLLRHDGESRAITIEASFWPNAFTADQKVHMVLSGGGQDISLPATASDHYVIVSDEPLAERTLAREFRQLREADVITVRAEGLPHALGVRMIPRLSGIVSDLGTCARMLTSGEP